jgi:hypothetical protein
MQLAGSLCFFCFYFFVRVFGCAFFPFLDVFFPCLAVFSKVRSGAAAATAAAQQGEGESKRCLATVHHELRGRGFIFLLISIEEVSTRAGCWY